MLEHAEVIFPHLIGLLDKTRSQQSIRHVFLRGNADLFTVQESALPAFRAVEEE